MITNLSLSNESLYGLRDLPALSRDHTVSLDGTRRDLLAEGLTYVAVCALSEYLASIIAQTESRSNQAPSAPAAEQPHKATMIGKPQPAALESAGRAPRSPAPDRQAQPLVALTAREREVVRLLDEGLSDSAIAATLFVSRRTVNSHLRSIYGKFNVGSRTAAVHAGRNAGYL